MRRREFLKFLGFILLSAPVRPKRAIDVVSAFIKNDTNKLMELRDYRAGAKEKLAEWMVDSIDKSFMDNIAHYQIWSRKFYDEVQRKNFFGTFTREGVEPDEVIKFLPNRITVRDGNDELKLFDESTLEMVPGRIVEMRESNKLLREQQRLNETELFELEKRIQALSEENWYRTCEKCNTIYHKDNKSHNCGGPEITEIDIVRKRRLIDL